ncbi:PaaI family thioesterase [Spirosoma sp.]|uniref:PaaI family thioesterase n=1 Tax=Spirosoma sp. TaxID=1899569 RepID=UPI003B3A08F9
MDNIANRRLDFLRNRVGQPMSDSISPLGRWLRGTVRRAEYGHLVVDFLIREEMTNPAGILHGGAAAAMLDDLIGTMVFALGREYAYTSVNLNIDFLNAARIDEIVTATAEVVREGKNIVHCEGRIMGKDGKIVAKCTTNLIQTSIKLII